MHSFVFRGKKLFWTLGLHLIPISTAILFVLNIEPFYSIPIPTEQELLIIGTTTIIAFSFLFIQTIVAYVYTLNYIESSKEEVSYSYKQVLELNQILNHNLRTPLATALGQLEIAEIHLKENKHIAKAKEALSLVVNQTASVNNAKKLFIRLHR
jgi:signal transduction histidine kinase